MSQKIEEFKIEELKPYSGTVERMTKTKWLKLLKASKSLASQTQS